MLVKLIVQGRYFWRLVTEVSQLEGILMERHDWLNSCYSYDNVLHKGFYNVHPYYFNNLNTDA